MDDLLREFLTETSESLAVLDVELVKLEQNPNNPDLLGSIFRLVHTIKGTCGFIGLPRLESVAHAGENILGKLRDGALEVTPAAVSLILECLDRVRTIMTALEAAETEPAGEDGELIARLNALADGTGAPAPAAKAPEPEPKGSLFEQVGGLATIDAFIESLYMKVMADDRLKGFVADVNLDRLQAGQRDSLGMLLGGPSGGNEAALAAGHEWLVSPGMGAKDVAILDGYLNEAMTALEVPAKAITAIMHKLQQSRGLAGGNAPAPAAIVAPEPAAPEPTIAAPATKERKMTETKAKVEGENAEAKESAVAAQSIRVNVDLLENLMTTVSELVLTRNQVLQILRTKKDSDFAAPLQRLNHITSELQEGVMKTRMQPIGNAWAKLPRLVRDLAHELGKKIDLVMLGAETELDRQVLEMIKDPLTHMVRNSADHGLETPADRRATGKSETGKVTLNAYHEGGHIIIEIKDDGRGLPLDKIKAKVVQNGLATEAELTQMSVQQIQQYIFKAGFSTAAKVTSVSGRGVGMDVVRTNIERIGGTVEMRSVEGQGSTFVIKIPLTLAIVSALIVACGGERFAIPQISVLELVRVSPNSEHKVERIKSTPVLRLRDRLLPLVMLNDMMGLTSGAGVEATEHYIVVTQVGTHSFGIMVDRVFDTEEIVVKPVAPILRDIAMFAGNTILGDGSVIMILDPNGIAAASGQMNASGVGNAEVATQQGKSKQQRQSMLVFTAANDTPKAVPLALVARLEEIDVSQIERSNGQLVVQYRGQLMPLVPMAEDFKIRESGRQPMLVFSDRDRTMGLVVDRIVDIVECDLDVKLSSDRSGYLGTAVINGHATEIVDAGHFLTQAFGDWFGSAGESDFEIQNRRRLLLVDDSAFFRNLLAPLLSVAGYSVTTAESADKAMTLHESGDEFDVIISDIEMPGMNGFEFAETVKKSQRWRDTPMVALSSHASPRDIDRGRKAGFADYVAKFDRDGLLQALSETFTQLRGAA